MDRRKFLHDSGALLGTFLPGISSIAEAANLAQNSPFYWSTEFLKFSFAISAGRLRQGSFAPLGISLGPNASDSNGVEVALQCTGENSPDSGMKSAMGMPGIRLQFAGKREEPTPNGQRLTLAHRDSVLSLRVESVYEAFANAPMVRRHTKITNEGNAPVGIDFLSSAMLHGLADPQHFDSELRIHLAVNSWMAEGQWHTFRPSELGFVENERTSWSEASASSDGSWSTEKYLPMAIVENTQLGLVWFWQIEHDGSWYWEISRTGPINMHHRNLSMIFMQPRRTMPRKFSA
jgi:alpha-galactosidase